MVASDEGGAAGGAALLSVVVGEQRTLVGNAIDVGRAATHHTPVVGADIPHAHVVTENDENVGFVGGLRGRPGRQA